MNKPKQREKDKNMTTPNKTSTSRQDAVLGQPAQCKPDERAIYPVRFSLTGEALDKAAKSGEVPPMPTGLNDKNYELRLYPTTKYEKHKNK